MDEALWTFPCFSPGRLSKRWSGRPASWERALGTAIIVLACCWYWWRGLMRKILKFKIASWKALNAMEVIGHVVKFYGFLCQQSNTLLYFVECLNWYTIHKRVVSNADPRRYTNPVLDPFLQSLQISYSLAISAIELQWWRSEPHIVECPVATHYLFCCIQCTSQIS